MEQTESINIAMGIIMMILPLFIVLQTIIAHIVVFTNLLTDDINIKAKACLFCLPTILVVFIIKIFIQQWKENFKSPQK